MERLLRERECDVSNRAAVCRLQSFARHGRAGDVASCSLVSKSLDSAQNAGVGLARLTQLAEALKRRYLAPIRLQNSLGQTGDRDRELVIGVVGKVLDGVIDKGHQRRQFVGGGAQSGLQHGNNALTES